jgi:hypothetical protein
MTTVGVFSAALSLLLIITIFSKVNGTKTMTKAKELRFFSESIGVDGGDRTGSKRWGPSPNSLNVGGVL